MNKQKSGGQNRQSAAETASKTGGSQDVRSDQRGAREVGSDAKSGAGKSGGAKRKRKH